MHHQSNAVAGNGIERRQEQPIPMAVERLAVSIKELDDRVNTLAEKIGSPDSRVERGMTMQVQKPEKRVETGGGRA